MSLIFTESLGSGLGTPALQNQLLQKSTRILFIHLTQLGTEFMITDREIDGLTSDTITPTTVLDSNDRHHLLTPSPPKKKILAEPN